MRLQLIKATNSITYECVASKSTRSVTPDLERLPYSQSGTQFDHRHAHLLAQQQDHGLHHEGKSAASPSPRHRGLQDPVFLATGAGYPGIEFGAMLPELQMPSPPCRERPELSALRASGLAARLEIQPELQLSPTNIHLALDHFPSPSQTRRFAEKNIGIHSPESALPIWRAPALPVLAEGPHPEFPRTPAAASGAGLGGAQPPSNQFHEF